MLTATESCHPGEGDGIADGLPTILPEPKRMISRCSEQIGLYQERHEFRRVPECDISSCIISGNIRDDERNMAAKQCTKWQQTTVSSNVRRRRERRMLGVLKRHEIEILLKAGHSKAEVARRPSLQRTPRIV